MSSSSFPYDFARHQFPYPPCIRPGCRSTYIAWVKSKPWRKNRPKVLYHHIPLRVGDKRYGLRVVDYNRLARRSVVAWRNL